MMREIQFDQHLLGNSELEVGQDFGQESRFLVQKQQDPLLQSNEPLHEFPTHLGTKYTFFWSRASIKYSTN